MFDPKTHANGTFESAFGPVSLLMLQDEANQLVQRARAFSAALGGRGAVPHAVNCAATHAQDALGNLMLAGSGGSPGIP